MATLHLLLLPGPSLVWPHGAGQHRPGVGQGSPPASQGCSPRRDTSRVFQSFSSLRIFTSAVNFWGWKKQNWGWCWGLNPNAGSHRICLAFRTAPRLFPATCPTAGPGDAGWITEWSGLEGTSVGHLVQP